MAITNFEFQLYRALVVDRPQLDLFSEIKPADLLRKSILDAPGSTFRKRNWKVDNVISVDEQSLYFRFGRLKKEPVERFGARGFYVDEDDRAPFTHILVDWKIELLGIAKKSSLGSMELIAKRLEQTLNLSQSVSDAGKQIHIRPIHDPDDLISHIRAAHKIRCFWYTVPRPNLDDDEEDYFNPLKKINVRTGSDEAKVSLEAEDTYERKELEKIAAISAKMGGDAGIRYQPNPGARTILRTLRSRIAFDFVDIARESLERAMRKIREKFENVSRKN